MMYITVDMNLRFKIYFRIHRTIKLHLSFATRSIGLTIIVKGICRIKEHKSILRLGPFDIVDNFHFEISSKVAQCTKRIHLSEFGTATTSWELW